jgi:hypothetical protein
MASADVPPSSAQDLDLDALIGDIRRESARRRAAPDFPVDEEARLAAEAERQAPAGNRPRLERLVDSVQALAATGGAVEPASGSTRFQPWRPSAQMAGLRRGFSDLAGSVSAALRIVSGRLGDLEQRMRRLEGRRLAPPTGGSVEPALGPVAGREADLPDVQAWTGAVEEVARTSGGRFLYAGGDAADQARRLQEQGVDAYGFMPSGSPYDDEADVRHGDLPDHLTSVADRSLAGVVLSEPACRVEPGRLAGTVAELARVASSVSVVSEAPWWWALRVGDVSADLAFQRPLAAETWISLLDRAGFAATAAFDPVGRTYMVSAVTRSSGTRSSGG